MSTAHVKAFTEKAWEAFLPGDRAVWERTGGSNLARVIAVQETCQLPLGCAVLRANQLDREFTAVVSVGRYFEEVDEALAGPESVNASATYPELKLSFPYDPDGPHYRPSFERVIALADNGRRVKEECAVYLEGGGAVISLMGRRRVEASLQSIDELGLLEGIVQTSFDGGTWPMIRDKMKEHAPPDVVHDMNLVAIGGLTVVGTRPITFDQGR